LRNVDEISRGIRNRQRGAPEDASRAQPPKTLDRRRVQPAMYASYGSDIPTAEAVAVSYDEAPQAGKGGGDFQQDPRSQTTRSDAETLAVLENQLQLPNGLAQSFLKSTKDFALRYWIIDNSGSMGLVDGSRLVKHHGREGMVSCTRWEELCASIEWHAKLAIELGAWTSFRLLNQAAGPRVVTVGTTVGSADAASANELGAIQQLIAGSPTGRTPLCAAIDAIVAELRQHEAQLRQRGQKAVVVIASDGEASDGDVAAALRPLTTMPVWVVVRLCTDNDDVVQYWNSIDEDLERKPARVVKEYKGPDTDVEGLFLLQTL